jgi:thiol-disulfide isomerase/thioredoxin
MNKQIIFAVLGVVVLLLAIGLVSSPASSRQATKSNESTSADVQATIDVNKTSTLDAFAQCLASKNLTMYGAEWCSHCKKEKSRFGTAFKYVPYVECPDNVQLCLAKGIKGYPTWIDASSTLYEGEQGLEGLAKISGCELPAAI